MGKEAFCKGGNGGGVKEEWSTERYAHGLLTPTPTVLGSKQAATAEVQTLKADGPLPPQTSYSG